MLLLRVKLYFFTLFLAFGAFSSMMGVFYASVLGFTGVQVGLLSSVSPLVNIVLTPFWTFIGDKYHAYKHVLLFNSFLSSLLGLCLMYLGISSHNQTTSETGIHSQVFTPVFSAAFAIVLFLAVFMSPLSATLDTIVLETIKREMNTKDTSNYYGQQRAIGSFAYGVGASAIAYLADPKKTNMELMFWSYLIMVLVFDILLLIPDHSMNMKAGNGSNNKGNAYTEIDVAPDVDQDGNDLITNGDKSSKSSDEDLEIVGKSSRIECAPPSAANVDRKISIRAALKRLWDTKTNAGTVLSFWLFVLLQGIGFAIPGNFLFIVMYANMNAYDSMILSVTVARIALEIPFFYFNSQATKAILRLFSSSNGEGESTIGSPQLRWMMVFGVAMHVFRMGVTGIVISFKFSPWMLVASEGLHGIIFATFYSAAVQLAARMAPSELIGVSQGMFNAMFGGVGPFVGSIVGGFIYSQFGPAALFYIFSALNLSGVILYALDIKRVQHTSHILLDEGK